MKNKSIGGSVCLALAAVIWGSTFVAQEESTVGPFTFQGSRNVVGALFLLAVICIITSVKKANGTYVRPSHEENKKLLIGGACCGVVLCLAMNLQQVGIYYGSGAGKAGFITAMYILIVPLCGIFAHKKPSLKMWCCIAVAAVGLFLLCFDVKALKNGEGMGICVGDFFVFLSALSFALHIVAVDKFVANADGIKLSFVQFAVAGVVSCVLMLLFENPAVADIKNGSFQILYAGICSSGIAYTLQIVGQKSTPPVVASLLMSLESAFAMLTQIAVIGRIPLLYEGIGCVVMFFAIMLAQLPSKKVMDNE